MPHKFVHIIGARPQFIKVAPLLRSFNATSDQAVGKLKQVLVHTGQHYDDDMSAIFFRDLKIPAPDYNLGVGSALHGKQTGEMLSKIEKVLLDLMPNMVIIYGDTNSTVAGALAASKLHIPVVHIEAGLRSYNRFMPEEINRIVSDHISDILMAPTPTAIKNLEGEGLGKRSYLTGDIMYDALIFNSEIADEKSQILEQLKLTKKQYLLLTVHRAENTDRIENLKKMMQVFSEISDLHYDVVFPIHPRTRKLLNENVLIKKNNSQFKIIDPVGYLDMLKLTKNARITFTDSGGLQKEAYFLNSPCVTLRNETEWSETVTGRGNIIAGTDPIDILNAFNNWENKVVNSEIDFSAGISEAFGKGNSADKMNEIILSVILNR
jgi:UDP-N-acetylglucosamine 2-epimerase